MVVIYLAVSTSAGRRYWDANLDAISHPRACHSAPDVIYRRLVFRLYWGTLTLRLMKCLDISVRYFLPVIWFNTNTAAPTMTGCVFDCCSLTTKMYVSFANLGNRWYQRTHM